MQAQHKEHLHVSQHFFCNILYLRYDKLVSKFHNLNSKYRHKLDSYSYE